MYVVSIMSRNQNKRHRPDNSLHEVEIDGIPQGSNPESVTFSTIFHEVKTAHL